MIAYVETNFVLEMALEQEQSSAARALLSLAESGQIGLAFPSFVLCEPFETIMRSRRECNVIEKSLVERLNQLKRSEPHKLAMIDAEPTVNLLRGAYLKEVDLLHTIFDQLLSIGRCIYVEASNFREASAYQRSLILSPQDSIIYAVMLADLKKQPAQEMKCFLSRDYKAFGSDKDRGIKDELGKYNCRYIGSFTQGLDFIKKAIDASRSTDNTK
jgi:predicted nucleic acid-binding protein